MRYDAEMAIFDVLDLYKDKLNAAITAINSEKNDGLVLDAIPNDTYVFDNFPSQVVNYEVALVWGLSSGESVKSSQENNFIEPINITLEICVADDGGEDRLNQLKKLLRYSRALQAVIMENYDVLRGYGRPVIRSLEPNGFSLSNKLFLCAGIQITASITAA